MSLEHALESLSKNVLFSMSLGSKELFHSNFLGWLFETYPDQSRVLLQPFLEEGHGETHKVTREEGNVDLRVTYPKCKAVFIENKVKSMPDLMQLASYEERHGGNKDIVFLLLSLAPKPWSGSTYGRWQYLGYDALALSLPEVVSNMEKSDKCSFDIEVVRRYTKLIQDVLVVAEEAKLGQDSDDFFKDELRKELGRIYDLFYKLRASYLVNQIQEETRKLLLSVGLNPDQCFFSPYQKKGADKPDLKSVQSDFPQFYIESGFSHMHSVVTVYCKLPHQADVLGLQLQGGNLRLCILTPDGLNRKEREERARVIQDENIWFDFEPVHEILDKRDFTVRPEDRTKWGCFAPDFVYRSTDIIGSTSPTLPIGTVRSLILTYIKKMLDARTI